MAYTPTTWVDGSTPVNAANLNKIEQGVDVADQAAVDAAAAAAAAQTTANGAIPKTLVDAKGDLLVASADNVLARLAKGPDGQVLTADAAQALGLKWAPVAGGGGADLSYDGDWVAGTYQDGDVVVKDGIAYLCVGGPTAVAPDPAPWGAAALSLPAYGTSLPASPTNGQEAILVDSLTNPTYQWRFRYNAGASGPYKWEFVGGSSVQSEVNADQTTSSSAFVDLATVGPQVTVPVAGEYEISVDALMYGAVGAVMLAGVKIGAAGVANDDAVQLTEPVASSPVHVGATFRRAVPAGALLKVQYSTTAANSHFLRRHLRVIPVRVA